MSKIIRTAIILVILLSIAGCISSADSSKKEVINLNESLFLLKNFQNGYLTLSINLDNLQTNQQKHLEISYYVFPDGMVQGTFRIEQGEFLSTKGSFQSKGRDRFIILDQIDSSEKQLKLLPVDEWIKIDSLFDNYWITFLSTHKFSTIDKNIFWTGFRKNNLFQTTPTGESEIVPTYNFNLTLDKEGLNDFNNFLFSNFPFIYSLFSNDKDKTDQEMDIFFNQLTLNQGQADIYQSTNFPRSLDLDLKSMIDNNATSIQISLQTDLETQKPDPLIIKNSLRLKDILNTLP